MQVSYLWLKDFVDFDKSPEEIADILTSLGLECAVGEDRREWFAGIVTGRVIKKEKHPNADKLSITEVDVGSEVKKIVCGAPNVAEGQSVVVALPGAVLPGGHAIKKSKIRGETSEGMICSESELKLSDASEGIMILDDNPSPGQKLAERYEVCDVVLEVDLTPNRGDCASMIGVARDLAAALSTELKIPADDFTEEAVNTSSLVSVDIQAPDLCPRYSARVIRNTKLAPSPFWLRRRISAAGVRPVNNVVDITNYILMETGHPLHAFDYHQIKEGQIIVRRANEEETFTALDGRELKLSSDYLVIADGEKAVALAGVMGGQNSEVTENTKDILLESAFFKPSAIRRASKGQNLSSESSYRFERGTDVEGVVYAQNRAAKLLAEIAGGSITAGKVDIYPEAIKPKEVTMRFDRLNSIIGRDIRKDKAVSILENLKMAVTKRDEEAVTIQAPTFRFDIEREVDLIEEVARHVGYDSITADIPRMAAADVGIPLVYEMRRGIRKRLGAIGFSEAVNYSFICEEDLTALNLSPDREYFNTVAIDNPLTSEWTDLRTTLLPGLIRAMKGEEDALLFETGVVFLNTGKNRSPEERWYLSGCMTASKKPDLYAGKSATRDFFDCKGVIESILDFLGYDGLYNIVSSSEPFFYPKRQAAVTIDGPQVGVFGQLHPETIDRFDVSQDLFAFEIDLSRLSRVLPTKRRYAPVSRFPSVKRDLAVVAPDEVAIAQIESSIKAHGAKHLREVSLFDLFRSEKVGEGKKSVAFSLLFADEGRTMTDEEVDTVFDAIVRGVEVDCGATLR